MNLCGPHLDAIASYAILFASFSGRTQHARGTLLYLFALVAFGHVKGFAKRRFYNDDRHLRAQVPSKR